MKQIIIDLRQELSHVKKELAEVRNELELLRNGRNSKTSHTPPSHQIGRANAKSLRTKTGRKSGGQSGHEGSTLEMTETPDTIIDYAPQYCKHCGGDLRQEESTFNARKQEVVIPPIHAQYIEHRSYSKACKCCGETSIGDLPLHLTNSIQYGSNVAALVCYLSVYQYLPYRRIAVLLKDLFGIHISEGSIDNLLEKMAGKALPVYQTIQQKLQQSPVVGSDETGASVAGKKGWFHVWQNSALTFLVASLNRGFQTIEQYFPNGFPVSVYVSDCWAAQLKTFALLHQICIAHLLRELLNFEEALACPWSTNMKQLLSDALILKKQLSEEDYKNTPSSVLKIEERLGQLLQVDYSTSHKKVQAFIKRLIKNKAAILTFLHHAKVPPDNNGSERAIRNVKVKIKVSGQFRSERGAQRFAILRSIIDTTTKNSQDIFKSLSLLANLAPE
jgi:transposase